MYKCCIFDLDGTLINSIHALNYTINLTLKNYNLEPIDEEHTKLFVGDGAEELVKRVLIYRGDKKLNLYKSAINEYIKLFKKYSLYNVTAYDGIKNLLKYLKEKNIYISVLSNKPHERAIENVEKIFGKDYFNFILGAKENIQLKPNPQGVFIILDKFNIKNEQCLYFGDTNTDMKTGIAAGVETVGVTWGFRKRKELEEFKPKYIIDRPEEIIPFIEKNMLI